MEFSYSVNSLELLNEENYSELKKKCCVLAQGVKAGQLVFAQLIEELKYLLVNPSPTKREHGVYILTEVLKNLPTDFLNFQELNVISIFYTDKLSDHHQVLPTVLRGILTIIEFEHFPGEAVPSLLNALFLNIACQQQQQADRCTVYSIFQVLLVRNREELLSMGLSFVYGVISSIDGERDPRNLMFLFKWLKIFLTTIPLGHLVEEMFEVMACYFPVDFRAPPADLKTITREALAEALCPCLCAIPDFAEYCIPLTLEKLDSSLQIAKLDSLQLLRQSCDTFDVSSYIQHASKIWSLIQKEVFTSTDEEVKAECLRTLTAVINKMSQSKQQIIYILSDIFNTVKGNVVPDSKLFTPSVNILQYVALASYESALYVIKETIPILTNIFEITVDPLKKVIVLKSLTKLINVYLFKSRDYTCTIKEDNEELVTITVLCLKASINMDNDLRIAGFDCLSELAEYLPLDVRMSLYGNLHKTIIVPKEHNINIAVINCFKRLSNIYPKEINIHVLYQTKLSDSISLECYLEALSAIVNLNYFADTICNNLLNYATDSIQLAVVAVRIIKKLLQNNSSNSSLSDNFIKKKAVNKLIGFALSQFNSNKNTSIEFLIDISSVLKILIGLQDYESQQYIIQQEINVIDQCKEESEEVYVLLLDALVSRLRKGLSYDKNVINILLNISLTSRNELVKDVAVQLLANLINKQQDDDDLNKCLEGLKENCLQYVRTYKMNVTCTISWITKALVMRNHIQGNNWCQMMLDMLEQDIDITKGFIIIMDDNYESLSSLSYCNKMLLYQQKFFIYCTNKLSTNYETGKLAYLTAIGYLMQYAPQQVVLLQFKKILKLIVLCLEKCNDQYVLCIILSTIKCFVLSSESVIEENIEDLLLRILKLASYEHSMKVRIEALQCLICFNKSFPLYKMMPFKQKVLHELSFCIDDKKRLVRKQAMEARSIWFLLDAPM